MKKLRMLFFVAIATFLMVGNSNIYADYIGIDLNNPTPAKRFENYTVNLNYIPSTNKQKVSNKFLGETENILATWLVNETEDNSLGTNGNGSILLVPVMLFENIDLKNFKGIYNIKSINDIQFSLNKDYISSVTAVSIIIFTVINDNISIAHQQEITNFKEGWNVVPLTTPYQVPTDDNTRLLIGYSCTFNLPAYPLSLNASDPVEKMGYYFVPNTQGGLSLSSINASFLIKAGVTAEVSDIKTNANFTELYFPEFVAPNANFNFQGDILNWGKDNITSFEVSYKTADAAEATFKVSGINVAPGESYTFTSPNIIISDPVNTYSVSVTIVKVNDKDDEDITNNSLTSNYVVVAFVPKKRVFGEECTGTWCGYCPRGWVAMEEMKKNYPNDWIGVAVHNDDPMVCTEYDNAILKIVNGSGYPNGSVDRLYDLGAGVGFFNTAFQVAKNNFGYAELSTINYDYDTTNRKISFDAKAIFAANIQSKDIRFACIITEDSVRGTTSGYAQVNYYANNALGPMGGFENKPSLVPANQMFYNDVARAVIGTPFGAAGSLPANIAANSEHIYHFEYIIPVTTPFIDYNINYNNLNVIVILLNATDSIVCNAVKSDKIDTVSIATENPIIISTFPNPTKGSITLNLKESAKVTIWTIDGNKIFEGEQSEGISNIKLNAIAGTYILRTENQKGSSTTKFVVE